jgi:hypothetical protein
MDAFYKADRQHQFSYEGKSALFDYFDEMDEAWELDVIAICCDFAEYTIDELRVEYPDYKEESDESLLEYLNDNTLVMDLENGSYIVMAF